VPAKDSNHEGRSRGERQKSGGRKFERGRGVVFSKVEKKKTRLSVLTKGKETRGLGHTRVVYNRNLTAGLSKTKNPGI